MKVRISRVLEYPLKGFPGLKHLSATTLSETGQVGCDRDWCFVLDADGTEVAGKWALRSRNAYFFNIRAEFTEPLDSVTLSLLSRPELQLPCSTPTWTVALSDYENLCAWMSAALRSTVRLKESCPTGFPDDMDLPSFTLMSESTAQEIGKWFNLTPECVIARLRPNVLVDGVQAFEEYAFLGRELELEGSKILAAQACARCSVPAADPDTGVVMQDFTQRFGKEMAPMLYRWAPGPYRREKHGFYAAINTRAISILPGAKIEPGQEIIVR